MFLPNKWFIPSVNVPYFFLNSLEFKKYSFKGYNVEEHAIVNLIFYILDTKALI